MAEQQPPHVVVVIDPKKDVDWAQHPIAHIGSRTLNFGVCKEICALDRTRDGGGFFSMAHVGTSAIRIGVFQEFTDAHADILKRWHVNNWRIEEPATSGQPAQRGLKGRALSLLSKATVRRARPLAR